MRIWNKKIKLTLGILGAAAIIGGVACSYYATKNSNPFKKFYKQPTENSNSSLIESFYSAVLDSARLELLPGFTYQNPVRDALELPQFSNTGFLLLDSTYDGPYTSQIATMQYRTDEGSFISGVALGIYLNEYKDYFLHDTPDRKYFTWGTYGGMNYPSVTSYMSGFQNGINWFNNHLASNASNNLLPLKQIFLGTSIDSNFAQTFSPNGGDTLITSFLLKKVNCLIPVDSPQIISASNLIKSYKAKTVLVGVDTAFGLTKIFKDQKPIQIPGIKSPSNMIAFSSLKRLEKSTAEIIENINNGITNGVNDIGGFGYSSLGTISNGNVGISEPGIPYFIKAMQMLAKNTNLKEPSTYQEAISLMEKQETFKIASQQSSMFYVPSNDWEFKNNKKVVINNSTKYDYWLPKTGEYIKPKGLTYQNGTMPKEVPASLKNKISQSEWTKRADFNLKGFVKEGNQSDTNKIKEILNSPTSVLLDQGYAEKTYMGLVDFYRKMKIKIPSV